MKKIMQIIGMGLSAAVLFSCTKEAASTDAPKGDGEIFETAQISLSENSAVIYASRPELVRGVSFDIVSSSDIDEVTVDSPAGITAILTLSQEGAKGTVAISATDEFSEGSAIKLKAKNAGGVSSAEIRLEKAFLNIDRASFQAKSSGATVTVNLETNLSCSVQGTEAWVQHTKKSRNCVDVTVARNDLFEKREAKIIFSDPEGVLEKELIITQEAATNYSKLEREALIALFNATGGSQWTKMSNTVGGKDIRTEYWCTDKPINQWYGVEVGGDGHVMYLHLGSMNLTGELPEEIGDLVFCQELNVADNPIGGRLPERIGEMQALKSLKAGNNNLSGSLSDSSLGKLASKMKLISLSNNLFTGSFPEWIGDMPEGSNFWLQGNCLEGTVPQKVQNHAKWNTTAMDGSGKTIGQINMVQKEGYILSLE